MRNLFRFFFLVGFCSLAAAAQNVEKKTSVSASKNLRELVKTELAFARAAEEKGTKTAFLTYLADNGIIFSPTAANGKTVWQSRPESPALLSWRPAWADLSSDGRLGYTTGGWEFRPKGKTDAPAGFGEYVTIWEKQADGNFRAVLDIGISHPDSTLSAADWKAPSDAGAGDKEVKNVFSETVLTEIFSHKSFALGYAKYLAEDAIVLRDGRLPLTGKRAAVIGLEQLDREFATSGVLDFKADVSKVYGNLLYARGVYQLTDKDAAVNRWNFMQVWKFRDGRWQLVLDVFSAIPPEKK